MIKFILVPFFLLELSTVAYAHWGHVGEVAGHGHLLGLGAVVAAGVLAGILGLLADKDTNTDPDETDETVDEGERA